MSRSSMLQKHRQTETNLCLCENVHLLALKCPGKVKSGNPDSTAKWLKIKVRHWKWSVKMHYRESRSIQRPCLSSSCPQTFLYSMLPSDSSVRLKFSPKGRAVLRVVFVEITVEVRSQVNAGEAKWKTAKAKVKTSFVIAEQAWTTESSLTSKTTQTHLSGSSWCSGMHVSCSAPPAGRCPAHRLRGRGRRFDSRLHRDALAEPGPIVSLSAFLFRSSVSFTAKKWILREVKMEMSVSFWVVLTCLWVSDTFRDKSTRISELTANFPLTSKI